MVVEQSLSHVSSVWYLELSVGTPSPINLSVGQFRNRLKTPSFAKSAALLWFYVFECTVYNWTSNTTAATAVEFYRSSWIPGCYEWAGSNSSAYCLVVPTVFNWCYSFCYMMTHFWPPTVLFHVWHSRRIWMWRLNCSCQSETSQCLAYIRSYNKILTVNNNWSSSEHAYLKKSSLGQCRGVTNNDSVGGLFHDKCNAYA